MKKIEKISENTNYSAVSVGKLRDLMDHSVIHPKNGQKIEGKVLLKDATGATGTEISLQMLLPKAELPYFHVHTKNEETYVIVQGEGDFQVDEDCFPISEGSVIRIAPGGKRGLRNNSDQPMIYMVIQSKENSLEEYSVADGERVPYRPKWDSEWNK